MNKFLKLNFLLVALLATAVMFTSCDDDDPIVDTGNQNTPNGVYLVGSAAAEDFSAFYIMTDGVVEGEGFAATPRSGFSATYVYLNAGSFVFASVTDNVRTDFGGTVEVVDLAGENDQINAEVMKGTWTEGGAAITITEAGLHQVIIDEQTKTFMVSPVNSWGIIGNATPGSWGADTEFAITGEADEKKVVYTMTNTAMVEGEYKVRYNKGWKIIQDTVDGVPGYVAFTNYGGSASALLPGGSNISFSDADKGLYNLTLTWDAITGFSLGFERTGDIVEEPWSALDFPWGIIGAATEQGWDADVDLAFTSSGSTNTWTGTYVLKANQEFKFRNDENWSAELNFESFSTITGDAAAALSSSNGNILVTADADASYDIVITTSDEGETYNMTFNKTPAQVKAL